MTSWIKLGGMTAVITAPCSWAVAAARDSDDGSRRLSSGLQHVLAYRTTHTSRCLSLRAGLVPRIDSRICIRSAPSRILSTGARIRHITRSEVHNYGRKRIAARAEAGNSGTYSNSNESQPPDGNVGDQKASTKRAVERWWRKFSRQLKSELGLDTEEASRLSGELAEDSAALAGLVRETTEAGLQENLPQTVDSVKGKLRKFKEWNSPQLWKVRKYIASLLAHSRAAF